MTTTRRDILKGLTLGAGGFLLTPLLRQVQSQAAGHAGSLPQRFVFVVKSSGVVPGGITPDALKGSVACNQSLENVALPESLKALEPFKDQLAAFSHFIPYPMSPQEVPSAVDAIEQQMKKSPISAVLVEPIQGRAGIRVPPPRFLPALKGSGSRGHRW